MRILSSFFVSYRQVCTKLTYEEKVDHLVRLAAQMVCCFGMVIPSQSKCINDAKTLFHTVHHKTLQSLNPNSVNSHHSVCLYGTSCRALVVLAQKVCQRFLVNNLDQNSQVILILLKSARFAVGWYNFE